MTAEACVRCRGAIDEEEFYLHDQTSGESHHIRCAPVLWGADGSKRWLVVMPKSYTGKNIDELPSVAKESLSDLTRHMKTVKERFEELSWLADRISPSVQVDESALKALEPGPDGEPTRQQLRRMVELFTYPTVDEIPHRLDILRRRDKKLAEYQSAIEEARARWDVSDAWMAHMQSRLQEIAHTADLDMEWSYEICLMTSMSNLSHGEGFTGNTNAIWGEMWERIWTYHPFAQLLRQREFT